jgi:hypoxanthine phosphoribosyltransferase
MIPKAQSPEDQARETQERNQIFGLQSLIAQGKASEEQVNTFYTYQMKQYKDRAELVDYVLAEKSDSMSSEIKQQYEKIRQMTTTQLESFERQRTQALQRVNQ